MNSTPILISDFFEGEEGNISILMVYPKMRYGNQGPIRYTRKVRRFLLQEIQEAVKRLLSTKANSDKIQLLFAPEMESWLDVIIVCLKLSSVPHLQANDFPHIYDLPLQLLILYLLQLILKHSFILKFCYVFLNCRVQGI